MNAETGEMGEPAKPVSTRRRSLRERIRLLLPISCEEQERLARELSSAVHVHSDALEKIVQLVRSGRGRDTYYPLIMQAASAKNKAISVSERLEWHSAEHGC